MKTIRHFCLLGASIFCLASFAYGGDSGGSNSSALSAVNQGYAPFAIEITKDGQYAYLSFDLAEVVFKVRLADLTVVATADLSAYFPIECEHIALDATERKLFVYTPTWRKLLVLDTDTMGVIHTIDDYPLVGMFRSKFGSQQLVTWDGGGAVRFLNTDTYAVTVTEHSGSSDIFFNQIEEHKDDPTKWFVVAQGLSGGRGPTTVGLYDHIAKTWGNSVTFPLQAAGEAIFALRVLPNGQKAYVATFGGWHPEGGGYGWFYAVDLPTKQVKVLPIDGGALCLEANPAGTRLFVGAGWPLPNSKNLLVVDTASDSIVGPIPLGRNTYNWPYTQMNALKVDPTNPRFLYATSCDGNAFMKVDIDGSVLAGVLVLNNETFRPYFFVRRQAEAYGNILIQSATSFELNLDNANIQKVVTFPAIRQDAYGDIGVLKTGRLLIAQGEHFLEIEPQGMQLIATHRLPPGTPSTWGFVLSNDKTKIYSVTFSSDGTPNVFIAMDSSTFQVKKQASLAGGSFESRPFELSDGSKLYALGGLPNGPVVVHVIRTVDYAIQKTITFDQSDRLGISAGPNCPYAYDAVSHTLFVGATYVVLAIDTITDTIKKVIYLGDAAAAIGLQPSQVTYINAVGLVYNPRENCLYIAHLDRSFVSIYDLTNDRFLPKAIPLKGYFPSYLLTNDAYSKIYSLNIRSDSVSVIDVASKTVEKVIDLHDFVAPAISLQPVAQAATAGGTVVLSVAAGGGFPAPTYQWRKDGVNVPGATSASQIVANVQPANAGLYTAVITNAVGSTTSDPAILGVTTTDKVIGTGNEVGPNIVHPNGNTFDQVLVTGAAEAVTADSGQVTRSSFIDLDDDIVQVEFSGPGTLSLVLDNSSGPATAVNYNQPAVSYMKGHVGIVITGASENTNVSVFSVGRATAFDPTGGFNILLPLSVTNSPANNGSSLFQGHGTTVYDGFASLAFIAISSTNGKFGGLRAANGSFYATKGLTGVYAPGVQFQGPVFIGNINAFDAATPVIMIGSSPDTRITGGDLSQPNGKPVKASGLTQLKFTAGSDSGGNLRSAKTNKAVLQQNGVDMTAQIVVNPNP